MIVCIMRHGEADSAAERHLSKRGAEQVRTVLRLAEQIGLDVTKILSSPLARAVETAAIAKEVFGLEYTVSNSLEPEGSSEEIQEELSKFKSDDVILLVSHQPLVSKFLSDMLGAESKVEFSRGTLAITRGDPAPGGCVLVSLISPEVLTS
jgi:phosphohistidine phosphatase